MRQRLTKIIILFSLVGLPVGVTLGVEQLGEWIGLPTLAAIASPAMVLLTLEQRYAQQRHHQKAWFKRC